jgi:hypothetical protein
MNWLAKTPYYGFIGFVGGVTLVCSVVALFFDLMPGIGFCVIATAILFFYLFTIEAPVVECEWAGWILTVGSVIVFICGVFPVNIGVWVLAPLTIFFSWRMYVSPTFRARVNLKLFGTENPRPKVRETDNTDISSIGSDSGKAA